MKYAIVGVVAGVLTGCAGRSAPAIESPQLNVSDGIVIYASTEGMRAFNDLPNGIITNTKASPDIKSAYHQQREEETKQESLRVQVREVEQTKRDTAPGLFGKLLGQ